jgi:hypothetical protein
LKGGSIAGGEGKTRILKVSMFEDSIIKLTKDIMKPTKIGEGRMGI